MKLKITKNRFSKLNLETYSLMLPLQILRVILFYHCVVLLQ